MSIFKFPHLGFLKAAAAGAGEGETLFSHSQSRSGTCSVQLGQIFPLRLESRTASLHPGECRAELSEPQHLRSCEYRSTSADPLVSAHLFHLHQRVKGNPNSWSQSKRWLLSLGVEIRVANVTSNRSRPRTTSVQRVGVCVCRAFQAH